MIGAVLGSLSHRDPSTGHVDLVAVDPAERRRGIGRELLTRVEAALADRGAKEVALAGNAPYYAWPGIDVRYTPAVCAAAALGYTQDQTAWNMTVRLDGLAPAEAEEKRLAGEGVTVRRAEPADRPALIGFALANWGAGWAGEIGHSIGRDTAGCWLAAGAAKEWARGFAEAAGERAEDGHPRYRGSEGMTSIPKHLARGLDVQTGERVVRVEPGGGGWEVACESGLRVAGAALLLTAPVPQSLCLVESGGYALPDSARRRLREISYDPCLALMALLDGPTGVPEPGGMQIKGEPLDWIGDNRRKGISQAPAVTIHAGPRWSRAHFEDDEAEITRSLLALAGDQLGTDLEPITTDTSLARWRYSWVTETHPESCLITSASPPLLFCGDAFGQAKVEGAALSGLAAADLLLSRDV